MASEGSSSACMIRIGSHHRGLGHSNSMHRVCGSAMTTQSENELESRLDVTFGSKKQVKDIRNLFQESTEYLLDVTFGSNHINRTSSGANRSWNEIPHAERSRDASVASARACQWAVHTSPSNARKAAGSPALSAASTDAGS